MSVDATQMTIASLMDRINAAEIRLPEIQRDYVWKSNQIAYLLDSLYREYPSGSLLLWESETSVTEKQVASSLTGQGLARPLYLLDGQQRLTSLHRVFSGDATAKVVFNAVTEKFQLESAATKKDKRWIAVHTILQGNFKAADRRALASAYPGELDEDELEERVRKVTRIKEYTYHVETVRALSYEEVTDIFVRVNSRGKNLTRGDLALATLTAKYPGFYDKIKAQATANKAAGFGKFGVNTLVRALAVFGTDKGTLESLGAASNQQIDEGWRIVQRGVEHLFPLLKNNLDLSNDSLLPSVNVLIPLVGFLGLRPDKPLLEDEANGLIYWLLVASLMSRYSTAVDTKLAQDRKAISDGGIAGLYANISLTGRFRLSPESLIGRSTDSAAFMLSFLAARGQQATDWWTAARIGTDGSGAFRLEYHHIHPQATLKATYAKAQINDIANLAFISEAANKRISARTPAAYFPDLEASELAKHFIPAEESLRDPASYLDFVAARRNLLVGGLNTLLDSYAPALITSSGDQAATGATSVGLQIYSDHEPDVGELRVTTDGAFGHWEGDLPVSGLIAALNDVEDGIATQIDLAPGEAVPVRADDGIVAIDVGPLSIEGSLEEWRHVLDRERSECAPAAEAGASRPWVAVQVDDREQVAVLECD